VATRLSAFTRYQAEEAWTWEHLALTRARVVAGDPEMETAVTAAIRAVIGRRHPAGKTLADVRDMMARLAEAHRGVQGNPWALKHAAGGLLEIELALQAGLLIEGQPGWHAAPEAAEALVACGWLDPDRATALTDAHALGLALQQVERVALDRPFDPAAAGPGLRAAMARAAGAPDFEAAESALVQARARAAAAVRSLIGDSTP
jgi:glutamate-ammonia-ligase adenylyltransferase